MEELGAAGIRVDRRGGDDRIETSVEVAQVMERVGFGRPTDYFANAGFVNHGRGLVDALFAGMFASEVAPVLLTPGSRLDPRVAAFAEHGVAELVGGTAVLSAEVEASLDVFRRYAGETRYGTMEAVLDRRGTTDRLVVVADTEEGRLIAAVALSYQFELDVALVLAQRLTALGDESARILASHCPREEVLVIGTGSAVEALRDDVERVVRASCPSG